MGKEEDGNKSSAVIDATERELLREIFDCVDLDGSGAIEADEMTEAMQFDHEVRDLLKQSKVLRPLLRHNIFEKLRDVHSDAGDGHQISWKMFLEFCAQASTHCLPEPSHSLQRTDPREIMQEMYKRANDEQTFRKEQTAILTNIYDWVVQQSDIEDINKALLMELKKDTRNAFGPLIRDNQHSDVWARVAAESLEEFVEFCFF